MAENYVNRVLGRVKLMKEGFYIGEMVDSDLENLNIDIEFEAIR